MLEVGCLIPSPELARRPAKTHTAPGTGCRVRPGTRPDRSSLLLSSRPRPARSYPPGSRASSGSNPCAHSEATRQPRHCRPGRRSSRRPTGRDARHETTAAVSREPTAAASSQSRRRCPPPPARAPGSATTRVRLSGQTRSARRRDTLLIGPGVAMPYPHSRVADSRPRRWVFHARKCPAEAAIAKRRHPPAPRPPAEARHVRSAGKPEPSGATSGLTLSKAHRQTHGLQGRLRAFGVSFRIVSFQKVERAPPREVVLQRGARRSGHGQREVAPGPKRDHVAGLDAEPEPGCRSRASRSRT